MDSNKKIVCLLQILPFCWFVTSSTSQTTTTDATTSPSNPTCDHIICYNEGYCNTTNNGDACVCPPYFIGDKCHILDMTLPKFKVSKTSITFTWPEAFKLYNFSCLYFEKVEEKRFSWQTSHDELEGIEEDDLVVITLPDDTTNIVMVDELKGDATSYIMCFFHQSVLGADARAKIEQMDPSKRNCGWVVTSYGGGSYTYAAKVTAITMLLAIVIIIGIRVIVICSDKDKRQHMTDDLKTSLQQMKDFRKRHSQRNSTGEDVLDNDASGGTSDQSHEQGGAVADSGVDVDEDRQRDVIM